MSDATHVSPPPPVARRRRRWWLLLLALLPLSMCGLCIVGKPTPRVHPGTVLELNLEAVLSDAPQAGIGQHASSLTDTLFALERARVDPDVVGLFARVGAGGHGLAVTQEVREAILRFKASGKHTIAFADTFGEMSPGVGGYLLASAFDEIWLQPSGDVNFAPVAFETPFLRGFFDKLGVTPDFATRKEYKNAPNGFTQSEFTAAHAEAMQALADGMQLQIAEAIASARPVLGGAQAVDALLKGGPLDAATALAQHVVDHVGYRDEALASLRQRFAEHERLYASRYLERRPLHEQHADAIAVIYAQGNVMRGASDFDPFSGSSSFGSDTVAAQLRAAADDKNIKAVVLRVDSPGGSYIASDAIWHATLAVQQAKKPLVVSMGNAAASGGYFVSMAADRIFALPGTLTGSIGVYAGKFVPSKLMAEWGIHVDTLAASGADASLYSALTPLSDNARAARDRTLDRIYADFVAKAARGRKMTVDALEPLAHGRVWLGRSAKTNGLIDDEGGLLDALAFAQKAAGLKDGAFAVRRIPEPSDKMALLFKLLADDDGDNSDDAEGVAMASWSSASTTWLLQRVFGDEALRLQREVLTTPVPNGGL